MLKVTSKWAVAWLAWLAVVGVRAAEPGSRPNVLFIGVDDLKCSLGVMGDPIAKTPNLDRLAAGGTLFTRAYVQQAVCSASRASLLTGYRPDTTTVDYPYNPYFREKFLPAHPSVVRRFFNAGYYTVLMGKIHHEFVPADVGALNAPTKADPDGPKLPWWQYYALPENQALAERARTDKKVLPPAWENADVPDNAYADGRMTDDAIATLRVMAKQEKPFFLATGYLRPHLPFAAPKKYWDLYDAEVFAQEPPAPAADVPVLARASYELPMFAGRYSAGGRAVPADVAKTLRHGYYAAASFTDAMVGRLVGELDALGLREKTIIVLWSDHGFHLGENGSWGKHTNYELATRSPLMFIVPGKKPGQVCERLVEFVDIVPTLCALAGVQAPKDLEGKSLVPLLDNPKAEWTDVAFSQFDRPGNREGYAVRTERYRYVEWRDKTKAEVIGRELYDHLTDPGETRNIAAKESELAAHLAERLAKQFPLAKKEAEAAGAY